MDFVRKSNQQHAEHFKNELLDEKRIAISQSWFDETTADYWRHARMYECADCLTHRPEASWLTVGDGRWGLDAIRLAKKGFVDVLPTDISEYLLAEALRRGLITKYALENAERLSFADESFDYVFCKESYHHFPRPYLALYEMLRVAREAVFLIEPNDPNPGPGELTAFLEAANSGGAARFPISRRNGWEGCGNYVYTVSRRELEKLALGLDLPQMVFKGLNDHYVKGCEFEPADLEKSEVFRTIFQTVAENDARCAKGQADYALLMCGLFKRPMDAAAREAFLAHGWEVLDLPRNPHIRDCAGADGA